MFKIINKDTRTRPVALFWRLYVGNFEHNLHLVLAFLLLTLKHAIAGWDSVGIPVY